MNRPESARGDGETVPSLLTTIMLHASITGKKAGPVRAPAGGPAQSSPALRRITPLTLAELNTHCPCTSHIPFPIRSLATPQFSFGLVGHVAQTEPINTVQTSGHSESSELDTTPESSEDQPCHFCPSNQEREAAFQPAMGMTSTPIAAGYSWKGQLKHKADRQEMTLFEPLDPAVPEAVSPRY